MGLFKDLAISLDPSLMMEVVGLDPDSWQREILQSNWDRALLLCSRQAGKSTVTSLLALHEALYRAPSLILLVSPSLRQSQEIFKKVQGCYQSFEGSFPATMVSGLRLELENGSRIISLPGSEHTIRGYSGAGMIVVDEAAFTEDELYYSVRPMLAVSRGRLLALTTAWGKSGWFYKEWTEGSESWKRIKVTADQCPRISRDFLEEELQSMGEWRYRREYFCEFADAETQLFPTDLISKAVNHDINPIDLFA